MWIIRNQTPFAVAGGFACDREGRKHWLVGVRATFHFDDAGKLTRAGEQEPVARAASFYGEPAETSLRFDSDLALEKSGTDVIVNAHAYAPGGRAVSMVDVGFQVGPLRKTLRVHGERTWVRGWLSSLPVPSRARPFVSAPIRYEYAFGGRDDETRTLFDLNPVGRGFSRNAARLLDCAAPTVEDAREPVVDSSARPTRAAGFGALAPHWAQRTRYAGTYDIKWQRERAPLWPLDFDPRYFQAAPDDQRVPGFLRGGEACLLHQLTSRGQERFTLPKLRISVRTLLAGEDVQREGLLHTVLIEPDERKISLSWNCALECHDREQAIERSLISWEGEQTWAETLRQT